MSAATATVDRRTLPSFRLRLIRTVEGCPVLVATEDILAENEDEACYAGWHTWHGAMKIDPNLDYEFERIDEDAEQAQLAKDWEPPF